MLDDAGGVLDPIELYRRATARALQVVAAVEPDQLGGPTPCAEWTVQGLIDHLTGGTEYLLAALAGRPPVPPEGTGSTDYREGVDAVLAGLAEPGARARTCPSPLGFEWSIEQAVAGTFMDVLVHTWDLARATGQDEHLEPVLVEACVAMFLPDMPERGREVGIVGPAVEVGPDGSPQEVLLGAMGRRT
jgi:uncharacterized protein (TIGR03086 family)